MILTSLDLFRTISRLYRRLLTDNNQQFTTKMVQFVIEEYEKKESMEYAQRETKKTYEDISKMNQELARLKLNRVQDVDAIQKLERHLEDGKNYLLRSKYEYFRPLKKSIFMLECIFELITINKGDSNLQGLGKFLNDILNVRSG